MGVSYCWRQTADDLRKINTCIKERVFKMNITYSTELMRNYRQANIISPQKKFAAVQTNNGEALLFSIGTDGAFYLIEQSSGTNSTGWKEINLTAKLSSMSIKNGIAKDFAVSQNSATGMIDLALVMTVNSKDTLYVSLGHSNEGGSITSDIVWTTMIYDDLEHPDISLNIEDVFISQSSAGEYIVADISKSSFSPPSRFLNRYYIDPKNKNGRLWNPMVMGGDLEPGIQTRIGRKAGDMIDGAYTLGQIGGVKELLYAPLFNPFSKSAPPVITRLTMPSNASTLALADTGNNSTDLFVAAGKDLYFFAADKQQDNAIGKKVFSNELFQDVCELHVYKENGQYTVWGLNRTNQVFYTSCNVSDVLDSSKWTLPLPIITGVDKISPFINRADNANTIISAGINEVFISVRSPETTIWNTQKVQLEAPPQSSADGFSSYTTRVQLDDGENNPLANTEVMISASSPIPVYINNLYYLINTDPIPVVSDALGSLTMIQTIDDLSSVELTIAERSGTSVTINPMEKPFNKSVSLDSKEKLKNAVIIYTDGTTRPLIKNSVSDADLESVALANKNLALAYQSVSADGALFRAKRMALNSGNAVVAESILNGITTDIGDLFRWLESGIVHTLEIIENAMTGLWHFVVQIGEKIYQSVLDTVEAVVGAVRWVYNTIKVAVKDLLKYLEFLFDWKDITLTKDVMKNMLKQYLQHEADGILVVKDFLDKQINDLVKIINGWAGIDDWSGLGEAADQPANASSTPGKGASAPGDMLSYHLKNNAGNITQKNPPSYLDPSDGPIGALMDALKKEGIVVDAVFEQLEQLASDYTNLDLGTILKRVVAIITDGVLESAEVVMDAMLTIVYELVKTILEILDTEIYIPVVSDILKEFGVPSLSFLDIFCWVTAVPVTIAYKIAEGKAPFMDNSTTNFLKTATSWDAIEQAFTGSSNAYVAAANNFEAYGEKLSGVTASDSEGLINIPDSLKSSVFVMGHCFSGFFTLMSCFISTFEAEAETGENPFAIPSAVLGVLAAATNGIAAVLVPKDPIKNSIVSWVNTVTTCTVILCKLIFSGPAQKKFGASEGVLRFLKAGDGRATGAVINSILVIPALACTCWHFYELSQDKASSARSAAIIDETANLTSYISRISYAVAVNDKDPESKQIPIGIMVVANVATSGLQTAEAIVGA